MKNEATVVTETAAGAMFPGWRETGDPNGLVMHFRAGAAVLCRTRGARAATTRRSEVNCVKCLPIIARVMGKK